MFFFKKKIEDIKMGYVNIGGVCSSVQGVLKRFFFKILSINLFQMNISISFKK